MSEIEDVVAEAASNDPYIGKTLGEKYEVIRKLGGGGMGVVYEARHVFMDRAVAIKLLHRHLADDQQYNLFLQRFQREARTASQINHPNAVTIYDFGLFDKVPYLAMQLVEGDSLHKVLKDDGAMDLPRVARVFSQICGAVSAAHALDIVHRDLKPDNIMVSTAHDGSESIQVLDFGIAKALGSTTESSMTMTKAGSTLGTPRYMSPEQVLSQDLDARSDLYSLGVVLYEMVSGDIPFEASSSVQVMFHHVNTKPRSVRKIHPELKLPKPVEAVIMKALEKSPDKRFRSAREFSTALEEAVTSGSKGAKISPFAAARIPSAKKIGTTLPLGFLKSPKGLGALASLLLIVGGVWAFSGETAEPVAEGTLLSEEVPQVEESSEPPLKVASLDVPKESPKKVDSSVTEAPKEVLAEKQMPTPTKEVAPVEVVEVSAEKVEPEESMRGRLDGEEPTESITPVLGSEAKEVTSEEVVQDVASAELPVVEKVESPALEISDPAVEEKLPLEEVASEASVDDVPSEASDAVEVASSKEQVVKEELAPVVAEVVEPIQSVEISSNDEVSKVVTPTNLELTKAEAETTIEEVVAPKIEKEQKAVLETEKVTEPKVAKKLKTKKPVEEKTAPVKTKTKNLSSNSIEKLIKDLASENRGQREAAAVELQSRPKSEVVDPLIASLMSSSSRQRYWAAFILGKLNARKAIPKLQEVVDTDSAGFVAVTAKKSLERMKSLQEKKDSSFW